MTLLEVLISMFIILFGLLGVAALLEVGRSESGVATRQDRAVACAESGQADVRVRRMKDPNGWIARYGGAWGQVSTAEPNLNINAAFVIDPLYVANYLTENPGASAAQIDANVARFPYSVGAPVSMARCSHADPTAMQWLLGDWANRVPTYVGRIPLFDRIFTWSDDKIFDLPKDPQQRPAAVTDAVGVIQPEGYYTWLATVCPAVTEAGVPVSDRSQYDVSIVVFYQRDFSPPGAPSDPDKPGERTIAFTTSGVAQPGVTFLGAGWGGGDVRLRVDSVDSAVLGPAKQPAYLDVRENDWIMLCGTSGGQTVFKWYRIIAVGGDVTLLDPSQAASDTNPWTRLVTLDGPDWNYGNAYGVLCTGVVYVK